MFCWVQKSGLKFSSFSVCQMSLPCHLTSQLMMRSNLLFPVSVDMCVSLLSGLLQHFIFTFYFIRLITVCLGLTVCAYSVCSDIFCQLQTNLSHIAIPNIGFAPPLSASSGTAITCTLDCVTSFHTSWCSLLFYSLFSPCVLVCMIAINPFADSLNPSPMVSHQLMSPLEEFFISDIVGPPNQNFLVTFSIIIVSLQSLLHLFMHATCLPRFFNIFFIVTLIFPSNISILGVCSASGFVTFSGQRVAFSCFFVCVSKCFTKPGHLEQNGGECFS